MQNVLTSRLHLAAASRRPPETAGGAAVGLKPAAANPFAPLECGERGRMLDQTEGGEGETGSPAGNSRTNVNGDLRSTRRWQLLPENTELRN